MQFALKERENKRRNKLVVDRHGDWKEQFSPVIFMVLCPCNLCYLWGLKFEIVVLHLYCRAELLEPYLQSILLWVFCK
jgi:hypothetical protein